jgi:hypothetical protein
MRVRVIPCARTGRSPPLQATSSVRAAPKEVPLPANFRTILRRARWRASCIRPVCGRKVMRYAIVIGKGGRGARPDHQLRQLNRLMILDGALRTKPGSAVRQERFIVGSTHPWRIERRSTVLRSTNVSIMIKEISLPTASIGHTPHVGGTPDVYDASNPLHHFFWILEVQRILVRRRQVTTCSIHF